MGLMAEIAWGTFTFILGTVFGLTFGFLAAAYLLFHKLGKKLEFKRHAKMPENQGKE